nr:GFP-RFP fusion protein [synthetic construct]
MVSELIKENMPMKLYMEGTVNNHHFKCTSEGEGKPYEGTQTMRIKVVEGGPLPFAFDILATSFMYGSRTFIKHPPGIPDFFKQSFPEGFTWERVTTYEDGGVLTATQDTSLQDGCLIYNVKVRGVNFPANGPVMQKKTLGWEASTETMYPADGGLEGACDMALKLVGGGHLICNLETTYRSKKPATNLKMPGVYNVDHRLERIKEADDETYVEQHEVAVARYSTGGAGDGGKGGGGSGLRSRAQASNSAVDGTAGPGSTGRHHGERRERPARHGDRVPHHRHPERRGVRAGGRRRGHPRAGPHDQQDEEHQRRPDLQPLPAEPRDGLRLLPLRHLPQRLREPLPARHQQRRLHQHPHREVRGRRRAARELQLPLRGRPRDRRLQGDGHRLPRGQRDLHRQDHPQQRHRGAPAPHGR